jgi:transposase
MRPRITASRKMISFINKQIQRARQTGNQKIVQKGQVILAVLSDLSYAEIAFLNQISLETIRLWVRDFLLMGLHFFKDEKKSSGRPPKLNKSQRREIDEVIQKGPQSAGYPGGCWRSPMIQDYIKKTYGVFYSVHYISELLKNMGFSFLKAKFVSDHLDEQKRSEWLKKIWPEIIQLSRKNGNAHILFGDEASFPQWGSLSYTWAKKGTKPTVKTSGTRKGYKVFGLIDYWTGRLYSKAIEGKFTSESYSAFLSEVLSKTRKHIILIQDGARYHTSKEMKSFFQKNSPRLTVFQMPSYSPDYNPIEKLWKKIKGDGTHLTYFPTFDSLKEKVHEMLNVFQNAKEKVLSLFNFYDELTIGAR